MTNSNNSSQQRSTAQSKLLPAVAAYLHVFNHQVLPAFAKTGSIPNAINARDGLAYMTYTLVSKTQTVALMIDDIIEADVNADVNATSPDSSRTTAAYAVPVRVFCPHMPASAASAAAVTAPAALPVMLYFHGGGGVAGSVSVYQQILCRLAQQTGHIVIAPEYRLAPENPYPCAQNDARTVLLGFEAMLQRHGIATTAKVVVAGDSHGGALVTNLLRDPRVRAANSLERISAQVLIYPSVDFSMSCGSIDTYASGYRLGKQQIQWLFAQYFQHGEDRRAQSALFASQDELAAQPPALIINAAIDPLYDEGVAYAEALRQAGVATEHIEFDGVIHAYLNMEDLNPEVCQQTYQAIATFLQQQAQD